MNVDSHLKTHLTMFDIFYMKFSYPVHIQDRQVLQTIRTHEVAVHHEQHVGLITLPSSAEVKRCIDLHVEQEIIRLLSLLLKMKRPRPEN